MNGGDIVSECKPHHAAPMTGFTMLEVIATLVLLALAAAVYIPRSSQNAVNLQVVRDTLEKHLRAAQMKAMQGGGIQVTQAGTVGQVYGLKCDGTSYWMFAGTNPDANGAVVGLLDDPAVTLSSGKLSLAAKKAGINAFTVYFNGYGAPCSAYTDESSYTSLTQDMVTTVTSDGQSKTVTITPYTGFIQ